jgi:biotin operon repressor
MLRQSRAIPVFPWAGTISTMKGRMYKVKTNIYACMVVSYLKHSPTPVPSKTLEADLHLKGSAIRKAINYIRSMGTPVCSDGRGYFIAQSSSALQYTIDHLRSRQDAIETAVIGLMKAKKKMEVQQHGKVCTSMSSLFQ